MRTPTRPLPLFSKSPSKGSIFGISQAAHLTQNPHPLPSFVPFPLGRPPKTQPEKQSRAHAPAIEAHRNLATATASACQHHQRFFSKNGNHEVDSHSDLEAKAAETEGPPAWAVVLPAGTVVCRSADLPAALLSSQTESNFETRVIAGREGETAATAAGAVRTADDGEIGSTAAETGNGLGASGAAACASSLGNAAPSSSADRLLAFDHVYPGVDGDGTTSEITVILYGAVGSPAMMVFHRMLKEAATAVGGQAEAAEEKEEHGTTTAVRYIFRHALPYDSTSSTTTTSECGNGRGIDCCRPMMMAGDTKATGATPLQGYGVVLDVKNMEYKNYDPSATSTDGGNEGGVGGDGEDESLGGDNGQDGSGGALSLVDGEAVGGVVLSTLLPGSPEVKRELGNPRQALLLGEAGGGDPEAEELKV